MVLLFLKTHKKAYSKIWVYIDVINNQQGSILVSISSDLQASGEIQILDAAGSLIQSKTISDHTTALAIKQGAGIYFVRVITPLKSEMKKIFIY